MTWRLDTIFILLWSELLPLFNPFSIGVGHTYPKKRWTWWPLLWYCHVHTAVETSQNDVARIPSYSIWTSQRGWDNPCEWDQDYTRNARKCIWVRRSWDLRNTTNSASRLKRYTRSYYKIKRTPFVWKSMVHAWPVPLCCPLGCLLCCLRCCPLPTSVFWCAAQIRHLTQLPPQH